MATVFYTGSRDHLPLKKDTVTGLDRLMVTLTDAAGADAAIPVSGTFVSASEYAEDTPAAAGDIGSLGLGVRADAATAFTDADGDRSAFAVSRFGETMIASYDPLEVEITGALPYLGALVDQGAGGLSAWKVDGSGVTQPVSIAATVPVSIAATVAVSVASLPLPTGASTLVEQQTQSTTLAAISGKLPATLGQKAMVASLAVVLASDQAAIPVTISGGSAGVQYTEGDVDASITGTAVLWEDAGNTLKTVSAATPLPVSIAGTVAVSAAALPLPAGAATEATLAALDAKVVAVNTGAVVVTALPGSPSQEHVTAASPHAARLTDGAAFYVGTKTGQLPAALGPNSGLLIEGIAGGTPIPVSGAGGGVQYTEGDTDASITGTAMMWEDASPANTLVVVSAAKPLPVGGTVAVSSVGGTVAISAVSLPLPALASQEHVTAASPHSVRLSDGAAFYNTNTGAQIPATLGQKTMPNSLAVVLASDQTSIPVAATLVAGTGTQEVVGDVASDAPIVANPVTVGGRASATAPTDVSADGDAVNAWHLRNGAQAVAITAAGALIGGDATNGLDVDVTRLPSLVAGTANIGDVDVLTVPAPLNVVGGGTQATALRVTLADDSTGTLPQLPLALAAGGGLKIEGVAGGVPVPVSGTLNVQSNKVDNTGFTPGTDRIMVGGFIVDETAGGTVTEDNAGAARMDAKRAIVVTLEDKTTRGNRVAISAAGAVSTILVSNSGVDIGDVDVASVLPGTGALNLGKAEDAPHASGDVGVLGLSVRNDNLLAAHLAGAVGDYQALQSDGQGCLYVNVIGTHLEDTQHSNLDNGFASLGVRFDAAAVEGATPLNPGTDLDYSFAAHDKWSKAFTADNKTEDLPHASGDVGSFILGVRNSNFGDSSIAPTALSGTNGDYTPFATDQYGRTVTVGFLGRVSGQQDFTVPAIGTVIDLRDRAVKHWMVTVVGVGGTPTAWNVFLDASMDGTTFASPVALSSFINHNSGAHALGQNLNPLNFLPFPFIRPRVASMTLSGATSLRVLWTGVS